MNQSSPNTSARRPVLRLALASLACLSAFGLPPASAGNSAFDWKSDVPQVIAGVLANGDSSFRRTHQDCSQLSPTATAVFYDTIVINNPTNDVAVLDVRTQPPEGNGSATCGVNVNDTVLAAYSGGFVPGNAVQGCIAFNDDSAGLDRCSRLSGVTVPANGSVTVVVTTSANGNSFPYDLRFEGSSHRTPIFRDGGGEASQPAVPRILTMGGAFTLDGYPVALPSGSRLNGQVDFIAHTINGPFGFVPMTASGILTNFGPATLRMQVWHAGTSTGTVGPGTPVTLGAGDLYLRLQTASINGTPLNLGGDCQFGPITWSTAGTWNNSTIAVSQASFVIPPTTAGGCNGLGAQLNSIVAGSDNSVSLSISP